MLATTANTIIPYAVGVDIACRMCLSIFDIPATVIDSEKGKLEKLLGEHTHFGMGSTSERHLDTSLFDREEWNAYLALLSHSGSRGFGGNIADIYSKIAMEKTRLPNEAKHLALPGIWRPIALR
ncbi:hypothetical protein [Dyadobacter fermentans]|uniref:hypothetical protein n=1 Tax=Dyadobacter fermentans TaxID=94254 RepID=UPI00286E276B|nr:hypothetical protein [Dyadobacter fermentans]